MIHHFLNLSNGILWKPELIGPIHFMRLESTTLESRCWQKFFGDLDHNLLMHLAIGKTCIVYDCGCRREFSKTIRWGIPLIRYTLERRWFGECLTPPIDPRSGQNFTTWFAQVYKEFFETNGSQEKGHVKRKLDYYKKWVSASENKGVYLIGKSKITDLDGKHLAMWERYTP
jgi:hypothetical protein